MIEDEQNNSSSTINNQPVMSNSTMASQPNGEKNVLASKMAKISLYTFIVSSVFLAVFGIIGIWTNYAQTISRLTTTFGIITSLSFVVIIGIRITVGKKK